jgi:battenin
LTLRSTAPKTILRTSKPIPPDLALAMDSMLDAAADDQRSSLQPRQPPSASAYRAAWLWFFILGSFNNFGYVVVLSAASTLAGGFGQKNLIGVVQWANVFFGIAFKLMNSSDRFRSMTHRSRIAVNVSFLVFGLGIVALSVYVSFAVAIAGIVFIGIFSSFGESVLIGYLNLFPPTLTGAWSSGTGMAGVGGTLFYLGARSLLTDGFSLTDDLRINQICFLLLVPQALLYWLAFVRVGYYLRPEALGLLDDADASGAERAAPSDRGDTSAPMLGGATDASSFPSSASVSTDQADASAQPPAAAFSCSSLVAAGWSPIARSMPLIGNVAWQLFIVYFLEYVVSVGFASQAASYSCSDADRKITGRCSWWAANSYEVLAFCYQFGVLISRSSVTVLRVHRLWVLTLLQAANFAAWLVHALYPFIPLPLQFVWMIFVGLIGGGMYVNSFFAIMIDDRIRPEQRETCLNVVSLWINLGIVSSALFEIAASATFLHASS